MRVKVFCQWLIVLLFLMNQTFAQDYKFLANSEGLKGITTGSGIDNKVIIKVIYDNYASTAGFREDWGYSIFIGGLDEGILFDTGTKPDIFEFNFDKLGIDPAKIDFLVLSHEHGDHTGGIKAFAKMRSDIPVIIPYSFSGQFKKQMRALRLEPLLVKEPAMICKNLYTSGEFKYQVPEQALVLDTKKGLVVMTGCSHPGIASMLKKIRSDFNKNIYMVFGGFHLLDKTDQEMESIISDLKNLGVVKCGATHCTGEKQIKMIREAFGDNYFELGAGNTILID